MAKTSKVTKEAAATNDGYKSLKGAGQKASGPVEIIRASKLAEAGTTGLVAEGIYEKSEPNKFNPQNKDYFIRNVETDTLYIVNSTDSIKKQMAELEGCEGATIKLVYNGKKSNKKSGRDFHDFEVFVK
jgi:hypothetical protein